MVVLPTGGWHPVGSEACRDLERSAVESALYLPGRDVPGGPTGALLIRSSAWFIAPSPWARLADGGQISDGPQVEVDGSLQSVQFF